MKFKIKIDNVSSVYSGKARRCACGCSGKHTYADKHKEAAGKRRGYEVSADEVNDLSVKIIASKVQKFINEKPKGVEIYTSEDHIAVETETRLLCVYFRGT